MSAPSRCGAPVFLPHGQDADAMTFLSIDAMALHLLRQRPGRRLDLLPQQCSRNGEPEFAVVAVFAVKPGGQDDWLGWTCGDRANDPVQLAAAIGRMRSAGGLAA